MINDNFSFSDFSSTCPICHADNCYRFLGFYYRKTVFDEKGQQINNFPIARFICRRKGKPKINHRTFSLLPAPLIPYIRYSIDYLLTLNQIRQENSITKTLDILALHFGILPESKTLNNYKNILVNAIHKLIIAGFISRFMTISEFINYSHDYQSKYFNHIRGPTALAVDYYFHHGGYNKNSHFLFGISRQFQLYAEHGV